MSFGEFIAWLCSSAALGVISSVVLTVIKKVFPSVADNVAKYASGILAAVVSAVALWLAPQLGQVPAWVSTVWPIIVWLAGQIWYEITK